MVDVHALASRVESLYADWRALERAALLRAPSSRATTTVACSATPRAGSTTRSSRSRS